MYSKITNNFRKYMHELYKSHMQKVNQYLVSLSEPKISEKTTD